jgi:hypothetical protein
MKIDQKSERMAETNYRDALDRISREYEATRYTFRIFQTNNRQNIETAKLFLATLPLVAEALIDSYLEAFTLEGKVPDPDDASRLDYRLETLFAGNWGLETGTLDLSTIELKIRELEERACEKLGARIHKMNLEVAKPSAPSSYNLHVHGDVIGGAQVGPNNIQNITGIHVRRGKPHIRWSQLRPEVGDQRVSEIGDVQVTEGDIACAQEIGGNPWIELHEVNTFGTVVRKYALGLFTPE